MNDTIEFNPQRASKYQAAMSLCPDAWDFDLKIMLEFVGLKGGETVLEIGAGSALFTDKLASLVGESGKVIATDPSEVQIAAIEKLGRSNIECMVTGVEELNLDSSVDVIWSRATFHHIFPKTPAFQQLHKAAKPGAKLVICDAFSGTTLAEFLDRFVALYGKTGHDVSFFSKQYAETLCKLTDWGDPEIFDVDMEWRFGSEELAVRFFCDMFAVNYDEHADECLYEMSRCFKCEPMQTAYTVTLPYVILVAKKL